MAMIFNGRADIAFTGECVLVDDAAGQHEDTMPRRSILATPTPMLSRRARAPRMRVHQR